VSFVQKEWRPGGHRLGYRYGWVTKISAVYKPLPQVLVRAKSTSQIGAFFPFSWLPSSGNHSLHVLEIR
jgi:hypothetical protein